MAERVRNLARGGGHNISLIACLVRAWAGPNSDVTDTRTRNKARIGEGRAEGAVRRVWRMVLNRKRRWRPWHATRLHDEHHHQPWRGTGTFPQYVFPVIRAGRMLHLRRVRRCCKPTLHRPACRKRTRLRGRWGGLGRCQEGWGRALIPRSTESLLTHDPLSPRSLLGIESMNLIFYTAAIGLSRAAIPTTLTGCWCPPSVCR